MVMCVSVALGVGEIKAALDTRHAAPDLIRGLRRSAVEHWRAAYADALAAA
jgi:hypothetical protein